MHDSSSYKMVAVLCLLFLVVIANGCAVDADRNEAEMPASRFAVDTSGIGAVRPECPTEDKLCIVPIKLYFLEPDAEITLQTHNGSNMLLQLQNESDVNIANLTVTCANTTEKVTLAVYAPGNVARYNRNWGGCRLKIMNVTQETVPAKALVFLVGQ